jgi:hypothetical protein
MAKHIDKGKYPDRNQAIRDAIAEKKRLHLPTQNQNPLPLTQDSRIIQIIGRIRGIYLAFLLVTTLAIIIGIIRQIPLEKILENVFVAACIYAIYFGLLRQRLWVFPLILFNAAISCFFLIIDIFHPAGNIGAIFDKILTGLLLIFYIYQIIFFRKREVREVWGDKGKIILD